MKVNYTPDKVSTLFNNYPEQWWIAGGWAIDLFLGKTTREHEDVDVAILREDELKWRSHLKNWELWPGLGNNKLENMPIVLTDELPPNREVLWCRPSAKSAWAFELLLNKTHDDEWLFKRDDRICKPISQIGLVTESGIPYLKPEIVLLYKAKSDREKDSQDFKEVLPNLSQESRDWLTSSLQLVHPDHLWISQL